MTNQSSPISRDPKLNFLEKLTTLSVDLHNINAGVQRHHDLSIVQWLVLRKIIDQPGLSAGTLAEISGVHPSTLTPTIARLKAMGLIYIQTRSSDLRRKLILVSWKGLESYRKSESAFQLALTECEKLDLSKVQFDVIRSITQTLMRCVRGQDLSGDQNK